jgi:hypothetical protein
MRCLLFRKKRRYSVTWNVTGTTPTRLDSPSRRTPVPYVRRKCATTCSTATPPTPRPPTYPAGIRGGVKQSPWCTEETFLSTLLSLLPQTGQANQAASSTRNTTTTAFVAIPLVWFCFVFTFVSVLGYSHGQKYNKNRTRYTARRTLGVVWRGMQMVLTGFS